MYWQIYLYQSTSIQSIWSQDKNKLDSWEKILSVLDDPRDHSQQRKSIQIEQAMLWFKQIGVI